MDTEKPHKNQDPCAGSWLFPSGCIRQHILSHEHWLASAERLGLLFQDPWLSSATPYGTQQHKLVHISLWKRTNPEWPLETTLLIAQWKQPATAETAMTVKWWDHVKPRVWARSQYSGGGGEKDKNSILCLMWVPYLYDVFISWFALGGVWNIDHGPILLHSNHLDWNRHRFACQNGRVQDFRVLYAHTHKGGTGVRGAWNHENATDWWTQTLPLTGTGQRSNPALLTLFNFPAVNGLTTFEAKSCIWTKSWFWQTYGFTLFEPISRFGCCGNEICNAVTCEGTPVMWQNHGTIRVVSPKGVGDSSHPFAPNPASDLGGDYQALQ